MIEPKLQGNDVTKLWIVLVALTVIFVLTTIWAISVQPRDTPQQKRAAQDLAQLRRSVEELRDLPAPLWDALQHADSYELFSIDPTTIQSAMSESSATNTPASSPTMLHGYLVLGSVSVTDAATRTELNDALLDAVRRWDGLVSACGFEPRHAIRLRRGGRTIDFLICFQCGDMCVYDDASADPKKSYARFVMRGAPPIFNQVLIDNHVPLPEQPQ